MTVDELRESLAEARDRGWAEIQLVVPRLPRGERIRIVAGVWGKVACVNSQRHTVVWVKVDDLERAIERGRIR